MGCCGHGEKLWRPFGSAVNGSGDYHLWRLPLKQTVVILWKLQQITVMIGSEPPKTMPEILPLPLFCAWGVTKHTLDPRVAVSPGPLGRCQRHGFHDRFGGLHDCGSPCRGRHRGGVVTRWPINACDWVPNYRAGDSVDVCRALKNPVLFFPEDSTSSEQ